MFGGREEGRQSAVGLTSSAPRPRSVCAALHFWSSMLGLGRWQVSRKIGWLHHSVYQDTYSDFRLQVETLHLYHKCL